MVKFNTKYLYKGEIVTPVFSDGNKIACLNKKNATVLVLPSELKELAKTVKEDKVVEFIYKKKDTSVETVNLPDAKELVLPAIEDEVKTISQPVMEKPVETVPELPKQVEAPKSAEKVSKKGRITIKDPFDDYI